MQISIRVTRKSNFRQLARLTQTRRLEAAKRNEKELQVRLFLALQQKNSTDNMSQYWGQS